MTLMRSPLIPNPNIIDPEYRIFLDNGQEVTFAQAVRLQIEGIARVSHGASGNNGVPGFLSNRGIEAAWCVLMIMP